MPFKDLLLHIDSYPEATTPEAIEQAVQFAVSVRASITALAVQVDLRTPSNWLASRLVNLSGLCAEQEANSLAACRAAIEKFQASRQSLDVSGEARTTKVDLYSVGDHVAAQARTFDLCLVPMISRLDGQRSIVEAVAFGSGRPVLLYRPGCADLKASGPESVVLAWDGSRTAARAVADALPLLAHAQRVQVLTVVNEKPDAATGIGGAVLRHLRMHGVNAEVDEVDACGRKIGQVLETYVAQNNADLLVMGAYGRSRMREFILGGATEHLLHDPKVPLFLSH